MKTLSLTVSALAVLAGAVIVSDAAKAQAWMDIARQPVPSFSASRGYTGDHSRFAFNGHPDLVDVVGHLVGIRQRAADFPARFSHEQIAQCPADRGTCKNIRPDV